MKKHPLAAMLTAALLACLPLSAAALTPQDEQALQTALQDFAAHAQAGRGDAVIDASMPPALLAHLADRMGGVTTAQVKQLLQRQIDVLMQQTQVESFRYDMAAAQEKVSANGRPYLLIPYETVFEMRQTRQTGKSHILALKENGTWYLLRLDQAAQLKLIQETYPDLADLTLPE
ncbi:MAG: hypothetical protein Q4G28_11140 [Neisseria sp.]|nr:hypothetical protein [Neisseria sp.]